MFQEPQGSEGEGESLCSGNQDSFYTEVLISRRDTSSLRVECVCVCEEHVVVIRVSSCV